MNIKNEATQRIDKREQKESRARLQEIADLYAIKEFTKYHLEVTKPLEWRVRVSSEFLKSHRNLVIELLRENPDLTNEEILKSVIKPKQTPTVERGHHPWIDCDRCNGTGWFEEESEKVRRCECINERPSVQEQTSLFDWEKKPNGWERVKRSD